MSQTEVAAEPRPPSPPWSQPTKLAIAGGFVAGSAFVVYLSREALPLLALSGLIAFLVAPLVRWMHSRLHVPRWIALIVAYLVVLSITVGVIALLAAGITASVASIDWGSALDTGRDVARAFADWAEDLVLFGVRIDLTEVTRPIEDWLAGSGADGAEQATFTVTLSMVEAALGGAFASIRTVAGLITVIVMSTLVTVMIAIYLNADSWRLHEWIFRTVPEGYAGDAEHLADRFGRIWRGYIYGQLVNSLITGLLVWLVLALVGLPGAFLMGVLMGLLNMIPTFGPILAAIPGILAALVGGSLRFETMPNWLFALLVAGIYVVVVQAQANLIAPKVMGKAVRLSPVIVLVALIVGFQVAGLLGSLLAVPVVASLKEAGGYLYRKLVDRDPFPPEEEASEPADAENEPASA